MQYKEEGIFLYKVNVLIMIVDCLALLSVEPFNSARSAFELSSTVEGMKLEFTSSRAPESPGFQIKTMMWTLRHIAIHFHDQGRYGEASFTSKYQDGPIVGFGEVISAVPPSTFAHNASKTPTQLALRSRGIEVTDFKTIPGGRTYDPADIYIIIVGMLIQAAEEDADATTSYFNGFNHPANLAILLSKTSKHAEPLSFRTLIAALHMLANRMPAFERRHQWKPFIFLIRDNGRVIGKGALSTGPQPSLLKDQARNATTLQD